MSVSDSIIGEDIYDVDILLKRLYFLRREKAVEEGRLLINPSAPSRFHSIFLTAEENLSYWIAMVGEESYTIYSMELEGNIFVSSDDYLPEYYFPHGIQVQLSENYWKPVMKQLIPHKEYLFQGESKIIKEQ